MNDRSQALSLIEVSRETLGRLEIFERLLLKWRSVTNLMGPSEFEFLWTRHFADGLQLKRHSPTAKVWADLGTGAGFPGLVLALDHLDDVEASFHLIEPDGRKCAFLREVIRETGARATVHRARAEDVLGKLGRVDVVTSRAMAPLEKLVDISENQLRSGAIGLFPKGRGYRAELNLVDRYQPASIDVLTSITNSEAAIIRVRLFPELGSLA